MQRFMAHAFAGIVLAVLGAALGATLGWSQSDYHNTQLDAYLLHVPWALTKAQGVLVGSLAGAIVGFPLGVLINMRWGARIDRRPTAKEDRQAS